MYGRAFADARNHPLITAGRIDGDIQLRDCHLGRPYPLENLLGCFAERSQLGIK